MVRAPQSSSAAAWKAPRSKPSDELLALREGERSGVSHCEFDRASRATAAPFSGVQKPRLLPSVGRAGSWITPTNQGPRTSVSAGARYVRGRTAGEGPNGECRICERSSVTSDIYRQRPCRRGQAKSSTHHSRGAGHVARSHQQSARPHVHRRSGGPPSPRPEG